MINEIYLKENIMTKMKEHFKQSNPKFLLLNNFLEADLYLNMVGVLKNLKHTNKKEADRFSYSEIALTKEFEQVFNSRDFMKLFNHVSGKQIKKFKLESKRFGWKDYTLMHDLNLKKDKVGFLFMVCTNWDTAWGGNIVYTHGHENYMFKPEANTLLIFEKDKDMNEFVKYVNNTSMKNSFVLIEGYV